MSVSKNVVCTECSWAAEAGLIMCFWEYEDAAQVGAGADRYISSLPRVWKFLPCHAWWQRRSGVVDMRRVNVLPLNPPPSRLGPRRGAISLVKLAK